MPRKRLFSYHSPGWDDEAEPEAEVAEGTPREQAKAELLGSLQR